MTSRNLNNISKSFNDTGREADCQMGHILKSAVIACQFDPFLTPESPRFQLSQKQLLFLEANQNF